MTLLLAFTNHNVTIPVVFFSVSVAYPTGICPATEGAQSLPGNLFHVNFHIRRALCNPFRPKTFHHKAFQRRLRFLQIFPMHEKNRKGTKPRDSCLGRNT